MSANRSHRWRLTAKSDPDSAYTVPSTVTNPVGPYMQQAPVNPFTGGSVVKADNSGDWEYNNTTGAVQAVLPKALWSGGLPLAVLNLSTNDVVEGP